MCFYLPSAGLGENVTAGDSPSSPMRRAPSIHQVRSVTFPAGNVQRSMAALDARACSALTIEVRWA
jgi:hypothetical protein